MVETYVADELKYCEVWITKGPSSAAWTRSRCLCQLQLPLSEVTTVKMDCRQAPGKVREHLFINFVRKKRPMGPYLPCLRNVRLQNDPLVMVWITVSEANGQRPKHAPKVIFAKGD